MIRNDAEYRMALKKIEADRAFAALQRQAILDKGLTEDQADRGMEPLLSFQAQLIEEVQWYERIRRREFESITKLTDIGRMLIALRIANNLSQKELAERLGVAEAQVSRDERNAYHNITVERAQRILDALKEAMAVTVVEASYEAVPRPASYTDPVRA